MKLLVDRAGGNYIGRLYQDGKTFVYNFGNDKERIIRFCRRNKLKPVYIYKNY